MFTDLVSSSMLIEALGDDASNQITRAHFRLLRAVAAAHDGHEVKNLGDGLMIVFPSALGALSCAVAMQRAVREKNEMLETDLEIRVGLHAGEPVRNKDDYFGRPVVIAKRLCDCAQGGQIVASDLVEHIVGSRGRFKFINRGPVTLKGISTPVEVREVMWDEDDGSFPEWSDDPAEHQRPRRIPTFVLVAVLGVVAVVAAVALINRIPTATVPEGTAGQGSGSSQTGSPLASAVTQWNEIDEIGSRELGGPGLQAITRMATDGKKLVAVGTEVPTPLDFDGAVWETDDPENWRRVGTPGVFDGPGDQSIWGVTIHNGITVAVGYADAGLGKDAAVWMSDGSRWRRIEDPDLGGSGTQVMNRVEVFQDEFLAVGFDTSGGDEDAAVWRSPDGKKWRRILPADADEVFGGVENQRMSGVDVGPKLIVAVGEDQSQLGLPAGVDGAVWTSRNATNWRRIPSDSTNFRVQGDQTIRAVQAVEEGFVAVGSQAGLGLQIDAAVWRSDDGDHWERVGYNEQQLGGRHSQEMWSVTLAGNLLYAVGYDKFGGGQDAAIWTSTDSGRSWARESPNESVFGGDRPQAIKGVVAFGAWVVAGGWDSSENGRDAQVWYGPLPGDD